MDTADSDTTSALNRRLTEISNQERDDPSRARFSGRDLGLYSFVALGITVLGFLVLAL